MITQVISNFRSFIGFVMKNEGFGFPSILASGLIKNIFGPSCLFYTQCTQSKLFLIPLKAVLFTIERATVFLARNVAHDLHLAQLHCCACEL